MKPILKVALFSLLLVLPGPRPDSRTLARFSFLKGAVSVSRKGKSLKARVGLYLYQGDKVKTGRGSRAEIKFFDGSVVRMAPFTVLALKNIQSGKKRKISLLHTAGRIWNKVSKAEKTYQVKTPQALAGVKGTVFRTDIEEGDKTRLRVYEGVVEVKSWIEAIEKEKMQPEWPPKEVEGPKEVTVKEWLRVVEAMQELVVEEGKTPSDAQPFDPEKDRQDPWVKWNLERDKLIR